MNSCLSSTNYGDAFWMCTHRAESRHRQRYDTMQSDTISRKNHSTPYMNKRTMNMEKKRSQNNKMVNLPKGPKVIRIRGSPDISANAGFSILLYNIERKRITQRRGWKREAWIRVAGTKVPTNTTTITPGNHLRGNHGHGIAKPIAGPQNNTPVPSTD